MDRSLEWENLTISNDFLFSKLMRDKEICKKVIEVLLEIKVSELHYIEEQKTIDILYDSKSIRLDVYVEDTDKIYNIEMQVANDRNLAKRSRYYQSMIDLNTIEKGELYSELKESFVIFICTFDPFNKGLPKYDFENICKQEKNLKLNDGTHKIFFNTEAFNKETNEDIKAFLRYIKGEKVNNNFIDLIDEKIKNVKHSKEWRREYMTLFMREQEIARSNFTNGKLEGKLEGKVEIAVKMLGVFDNMTIMTMTGLSFEEIDKLRKLHSM